MQIYSEKPSWEVEGKDAERVGPNMDCPIMVWPETGLKMWRNPYAHNYSHIYAMLSARSAEVSPRSFFSREISPFSCLESGEL